MQNGSAQGPREDYLPNTISEDHGRTALHEAAAGGDDKALETLLNNGADRNVKDHQHGNTALHEAAWKGYSRCVKLLCVLPKVAKAAPAKAGKEAKAAKGVVAETKGALHSALLSTRNFGGFSALHLAAQNGHNQSCREILLAGGDPNVQNNYGDTALHTACRYGHAGATRILLSAKCDSSRINLNGDTPLHISCAMGRRKLTRILMEAGSRLDIKNGQDETPRDISVRKNLKEILEILNTPVTEVRHERDRSSSSSRQHNGKEKSKRSAERDVADGATANKHKHGGKEKGKGNGNQKYDVDPKHWSPYGCHYFPDPRNFPSPKLETLPKEPLVKGEQYYLDLAGNIRKGPVGVGNTCYCAPFFKHLEQKMNKNRKSIRKYVDKAAEKIDHKVQALASKTDGQIGELTRSMIADRVQCENKRLHLEQWLKRGVMSRATIAPHTSKSRKDQANTNTLTRCRSLELLDDDDEHHNHMKTSTPHYSRSVELLDSQNDIIIHRDADYSDHVHSSLTSNQKNHPESEKEKLSSFFNSDKEHNSEKDRSSKLSSQGYSDNRERLTPLEKDRNSASDKEMRRKKSWYGQNGEHRSEQSSSLKDRLSGKESSEFYDSSSIEKIRVTERLEELLIKTKKILELEQISPKKRSKLNKYSLAMEKFKKLEKSNANLKSSGHNRSSEYLDALRSSDHGLDKYDIAEEMNKITKSLLAHDEVGGTASKSVPASPEIAKENTPRKEQSHRSQFADLLSDEYHNNKAGAASPRTVNEGSGKEAASEYNQMSQEVKTNGVDEVDGGEEDENDDDEDDEEDEEEDEDEEEEDAEDDVNTINGFYTNDCFDDQPSSSNNTLKSQKDNNRKIHPTIEETTAEDELEESNENEQCDISDMKNFDELNELKQRILNGTNWRSQVLKSSKQQQQQLETLNDSYKFKGEQNGHEYQPKYEIKNSEIKILKPVDIIPNGILKNGNHRANVQSTPIDTNGMTNGISSSNKVKELIAKLQGCQLYEESLRVIEGSHPNGAYDSESSEEDDDDEDDDDEDELGYGAPNQQQQQQQQAIHYNNYNSVNHNNNYLQEYKREPNHMAQSGHRLMPQEYTNVSETLCFIPKDAYFHEIPNKNRLRPITDNLPEQRTAQIVTATARNRNPLPIHLNEEDVFNVDSFHIDNMSLPVHQQRSQLQLQQQQPYYPAQPHQPQTAQPHHLSHIGYQQQPQMQQQNGNIIPLPLKEKLLTSRKNAGNFIDSHFIDSELMKINQQSQMQQQMHQQYQYQQQQALQYNSNYLATIQNERDAHNDSGYSTKICDSSHGPSPSLSGQMDLNHNINGNHVVQHHINHHHQLLQQQPQPLPIHMLHQPQHQQPINHNHQSHHQNSNLNNNTNENYTDYFLSNLGASSLV